MRSGRQPLSVLLTAIQAIDGKVNYMGRQRNRGLLGEEATYLGEALRAMMTYHPFERPLAIDPARFTWTQQWGLSALQKAL